jgi:hypothetical protein
MSLELKKSIFCALEHSTIPSCLKGKKNLKLKYIDDQKSILIEILIISWRNGEISRFERLQKN